MSGGGASPGLPDLLSPADVAGMMGVPEADVLAIVESGELPAKRIGSSVRIKRADVVSYLSS
jgi:excisionase family DNA binding protein